MHPWNNAKNFIGEATDQAVKTVSQQLDHATEVVKDATEATIDVGNNSLKQLQCSSQEILSEGSLVLEQTMDSIQRTGASLHKNTTNLVGSGLVQANNLKQQAQAIACDQSQTVGSALENWQSVIIAAGTSGVVTTQALQNLPQTAQQLAKEMPLIAKRMKFAGMRAGDLPRTDADVIALFNKIPGVSKLSGTESDIQAFLSGKHGSHIYSHANGGGNGANNILWEVGHDNIRRGAQTMTGGEQLYIRFHNAVDSVVRSSPTLAKLGLKVTVTAVLTQALATALSHSLDLYYGDISIEEFQEKITQTAIQTGIAAPIFFLIFTVVISLFPELVVILSAPAVVAGFNALLIGGIALPIIQSIIRHVEAGRLGEEAQVQYLQAIQQGDEMLQASSQTVKDWWYSLFENHKIIENQAIKTLKSGAA